jgi:hypothetical protein
MDSLSTNDPQLQRALFRVSPEPKTKVGFH